MQEAPKVPNWAKQVLDIVWDCWQYRAPSGLLGVKTKYNKKLKVWEIWSAPSVQEMYGGANDGQKFWPPFVFCASTFASHPEIEVDSIAVGSSCQTDENFTTPQMMLRGKLQKGKRKHKFFLRVLLQPEKNTQTLEVLDTIKQELRNPRSNQDSD